MKKDFQKFQSRHGCYVENKFLEIELLPNNSSWNNI